MLSILMLNADGFESARIGVLRRAAQEDIVVYDYDLCVEILREREGWTDDEAIEWMEYNVVGSWLGEGTPGFLVRNE